jgi:hypothetical protein
MPAALNRCVEADSAVGTRGNHRPESQFAGAARASGVGHGYAQKRPNDRFEEPEIEQKGPEHPETLKHAHGMFGIEADKRGGQDTQEHPSEAASNVQLQLEVFPHAHGPMVLAPTLIRSLSRPGDVPSWRHNRPGAVGEGRRELAGSEALAVRVNGVPMPSLSGIRSSGRPSGRSNLALIETDAAERAKGDPSADAVLIGNLHSQSFAAAGALRTIEVQQCAEQDGHPKDAHWDHHVGVGWAEVARRGDDCHRRCGNEGAVSQRPARALRPFSEVFANSHWLRASTDGVERLLLDGRGLLIKGLVQADTAVGAEIYLGTRPPTES